MTVDHLLGVLAIALGLVLVAGSGWIARQMSEAQRARLRRPVNRAMQEASERDSPSWMRGEGFGRHLARLWLVVAGACLASIGVQSLLAGP